MVSIHWLSAIAKQYTEYTRDVIVDRADEFAWISPSLIIVPDKLEEYYKTTIPDQDKIVCYINNVSRLVYMDVNYTLLQKFLDINREAPGVALAVINLVETMHADVKRYNNYPGLSRYSKIERKYMFNKIKSFKPSSPLEAIVFVLYLKSLCGVKKKIKVVEPIYRKLVKISSIDDDIERYTKTQDIFNDIMQFPGDTLVEVHEKLPIFIDPQYKKISTSYCTLNVVFRRDKDGQEPILNHDGGILDEVLVLSINDTPDEEDVSEGEDESLPIVISSKDSVEKILGGELDNEFSVQIPERITRELRQLLEEIKNSQSNTLAPYGTKVNIQNYIKLLSGDTSAVMELFEDEVTDRFGDRAVVVLVDMSASMKDKSTHTIHGIHVISTAVTELGDSLAIYGFYEDETPTVMEILPFEIRYQERYLSRIRFCGRTPLVESIDYITGILKQRPERERIAFVITDGLPTTSRKSEVREVVTQAMKQSIYIIGIGIGEVIRKSALVKCFGENNHVYVPNVEYLPRKLFETYIKLVGVNVWN